MPIQLNRQFFVSDDVPTEGPPRELVGYGPNPPQIEWPNGAKVAVQIVVNYEEGTEKTFAMGDGVNDGMWELAVELHGIRDLAFESCYEYGSRAGIWRLFRVFDDAGIPVTFFAVAAALERNQRVADKLASRGDEAASHGYRWTNHYEMNRDEEREAIRRAIESITRTTGQRPLGWYCREMSVNTRELLVEVGGFVYDSDCYNDDLPYWTLVHDRPHLVVPYGLVVNDGRYVLPGQGYGSPDEFFENARASVDFLRRETDGLCRMMSVGLHPRLSGHPGRADGLARFIDHCQKVGDVWIAKRIDIAKAFSEQYPAERFLAQHD